MANSILAKMAVQITANTAQFNAALAQTNSRLAGFENFAKNAAKSLIGVFAVQRVASFTLEISKLAGEAQGVNEAFRRLPGNIKLLEDLKEATSGTVSELDLMRRSVQASNFGISLKALPQLLEFATIRAKQTGESVDYLVNSIVTGIGRKSKLILDNLGISAVELTEALGGASTAASTIGEVADAVGKIAEKNLKTMGEMSENASTKLERLNANWINLKVALGDAANGTGILGKGLDILNSYLIVLASKNLSAAEKIAAFSGSLGLSIALTKELASQTVKASQETQKFEQVVKEVDRAFASGNPEAYINAQKQHIYYTEILAEYNKRLIAQDDEKATGIENIANLTEHLNDLMSIQSEQTGAALIKTNKEIKVIEAKIKALRELGVEQDKQINKDKAAALARAEATRGQGVSFSVGGFDTSKLGFAPDKASASIQAAAQGLAADATERTNASLEKQRLLVEQNQQAWLQLASQASDSIAVAIAADESFGRSVARVTASILNSLEQRIAAYLGEGIAKAFAINPIAGAAIATVGLGVIKGLLAKVSRGKTSYGGTANYSRPSAERIYGNGGEMRIDLSVKGVASGRDLQFVLDNYNASRSRTG